VTPSLRNVASDRGTACVILRNMVRQRRPSGVRPILRKVAICAVVLVAPPLTLAQTVNDTDKHWLRAAIVAFTWTLGAGVGTVLSSDLGSKEERENQD
jgi:hypothetical protein